MIENFLSREEVLGAIPLDEFYDKVIGDFAARANQLRLASMAVTIATVISSTLSYVLIYTQLLIIDAGINHGATRNDIFQPILFVLCISFL